MAVRCLVMFTGQLILFKYRYNTEKIVGKKILEILSG